MKCLNCGTVNKKNDLKCKKCGSSLQEVEVKAEVIPETKTEEVKQKVEVQEQTLKKKKGLFKKTWLLVKIGIGIFIASLIALIVYVYGFYDYQKSFEEDIKRYYETGSEKRLDDIKLLFKVFGFDDNRIEKMQKESEKIVNKWIDDVQKKEYSSDREYYDNLTYLQEIIEDLYKKTDVNGQTAISKKAYISINHRLVELLGEKDDNEASNSDDRDDKEKEPEKDEEKDTSKDEDESNEYDVSMMNEVDLNGVLKLFDDKKTYVLYIGRYNCSACISYLPNLQRAQEEYHFTIQYFDILSTDFATVQSALADKLTYKYKMEEDGEEKNLPFVEWYGYTPMTIIIKNGKQVDGEIGYMDYENLQKLLEKNGINK